MSTGNAGVLGLDIDLDSVVPDLDLDLDPVASDLVLEIVLEGEEEIREDIDIDNDCFIFLNTEIFIIYTVI